MKTNLLILCAACLAFIGCHTGKGMEPSSEPYIHAQDQVQAGRYLIVVAGCNDCHTEGYLFNGGTTPESEWLTGTSLGWRGPWGTTYPGNLRLRVQELTEDQWWKCCIPGSHFRPWPGLPSII